MAAVSTELPRSKRRHESPGTAGAVDSAVAICGVRSNELVGVAAEIHAGLADEIEEGELVVLFWALELIDLAFVDEDIHVDCRRTSRDTEDRLHLESFDEEAICGTKDVHRVTPH